MWDPAAADGRGPSRSGDPVPPSPSSTRCTSQERRRHGRTRSPRPARSCLPACVALYHHPDDDRYARAPNEARRAAVMSATVPVLTDDAVDPEFGIRTDDGVHLRGRRGRGAGGGTRPPRHEAVAIGSDGRMTDARGPLRGRCARPTAQEARGGGILKALQADGAYAGFTMTEQAVPIAERSGAPIEWVHGPPVVPAGCSIIRERLLRERSAELRWHPPHMKARLDDWIDGLKLGLERVVGSVSTACPSPCGCATPAASAVPARIDDLPVDPLEDPPPADGCPACGGRAGAAIRT